MTHFMSISLCVATACIYLASVASIVNAQVHYIDAFRALQSDIVWPVPQSTRSMFSSAFGPRIKSSSGRYDFHRGMDIHGHIGDHIVACYPGKVEKVTTYKSGGLTVILRHDFDDDNVLFHDDKPLTGRFYTLHMHMNSTNVTKNDEVFAGSYIGTLGDSGQAQTPHLHFEVRLGSRCSLEYALDKPKSKCNTYKYDPHVGPMLLLEDLGYNETNASPYIPYLSATTDPSYGVDGVVYVETEDVQPNINKYHVEIIDTTNNNATRDSWLLDLDRRIGYNATTNAALDIPDETKPYLEPISFGYVTTTWKIFLIIPYSWVGWKSVGEMYRVMVTDVWGRNTSIAFGDVSDSW